MSRARILLVEDEGNLRRILSDLLKSDGYTVQSSGDGLEAQELAMTQVEAGAMWAVKMATKPPWQAPQEAS